LWNKAPFAGEILAKGAFFFEKSDKKLHFKATNISVGFNAKHKSLEESPKKTSTLN